MDDEGPHLAEIAGQLRQLTARLTAADDISDAIRQLAAVVHGAIALPCGVVLLGTGIPTGLAASPSTFEGLDETRCGGDGPGMTAIRTREWVLCRDLRGDDRWGGWRERALACGVRAVFSVPVDVDADRVAAVTVYARGPHALDRRAQMTTWLLTEHAGLLLAALLRRRSGPAGGSPIVHRATGMIMAQRGCAPQEALDILQGAAASVSMTLPQVAERLVDTARQARPGPPAHRRRTPNFRRR